MITLKLNDGQEIPADSIVGICPEMLVYIGADGVTAQIEVGLIREIDPALKEAPARIQRA